MADSSNKTKEERAELYREFLEDDAASLQMIFHHGGSLLLIRVPLANDPEDQIGVLFHALQETSQRHNPDNLLSALTQKNVGHAKGRERGASAIERLKALAESYNRRKEW